MRELITEALVLAKEPAGEFDQRVTLFTEAAGKVTAKVTSGRKITAKLSPHLEPLNFVQVRLVEGRGGANGFAGFHVADALRVGSLKPVSLSVLHLVRGATLDGVQDRRLWGRLASGNPKVRDALVILGFDPTHAACAACGKRPTHFFFDAQEFRCRACALPAASFRGCVEFAGEGAYNG